jgi:iron complex outermembrane receptor protein
VNSQGVLNNTALLSPLSINPGLTSQLQGMVKPIFFVNEGTNSQQGIDLKASRIIGEIDGRDVLLALGTDWRQEIAQFDRYTSGVPSYLGKRSVWAQFAEIQLPLPKAVEVLASLRNDHYSDFGNTAHGKLGAKWVPNEQWLLRGAWSTGFRAPAVAQMQETGKSLVSTSSCNADVSSIAAQLGGVCQSDGFINIYSQGSANLKPELSTHLNLGVRFSPERNHTFSMDYWRINMQKKINNSYDFIFSDPARYISNFQLNANKELEIFAPMKNMGKTQTSGIDFAWSLRRPTDWGQLLMGVNGTWLLTSKYQKTVGGPVESDLNKYSFSTGYVIPKIRANWHAGLHQGNWQGHLKVNYIGSYDTPSYSAIQANTGDSVVLDNQRVPAWWTVDLMVMHQWNSQTSLRLGIENALNRKAPLDTSAFQTSFNFGTNPLLANVWGRTAHISLTHRF